MNSIVINYEKKIEKLHQEIYPQISKLLHDIHDGRNLLDFSALEENISLLSDEFLSLYKIESKLIFPAILAALNTNESSVYAPNFTEIIQLISSKEAKIEKYLNSIKHVTEGHQEFDGDIKEEVMDLIRIFKDDYFPSKHQWSELLLKLVPKLDNSSEISS